MSVSKRRSEANRANAQKSTGPKTQGGKAISSRNAVRHGLCATSFVLDNEDLNEYNRFRDDHIARFGPRDVVEMDLVDRMVHASWNLRRAWTMENETLNLEMFRMKASLDTEFAEIPERTRTAFALEEVAKKPTFALLQRYAARQSNEYQRSLKTLLDLRKYVPLAPPGPRVPDEPNQPEPPANELPTAPSPTGHSPLATSPGPLGTDQIKATHHCPSRVKALESKDSPRWEED
jgi:hypothetical protein